MERHGEDFWKKRIGEQRAQGQPIVEYCVRRGLSRSTFLRWRKRLGERASGGLVEIAQSVGAEPLFRGDFDAALELCIGDDIRARFRSVPEAQALADFIAAFRSAR